MDLSTQNPVMITILLFLIITLRYFLVAGSAYALTRVWGRERFALRKIQNKTPNPKIVRREIGWSVASALIFAASGTFGLYCWERGWIQIYTDPFQYGLGYLFLSFAVLMFLHDAYFYWMHRLVHHPRLFKHIHQVHHDSMIPTPWAAFSFHPYEALLEALILPALLLMFPVHLAVLGVFLAAMTVLGVVNHLGYEFYPKGFDQNPMTSWMISATNHDLHHQKFKGNYGLYFTIWDRWMGTRL
jgi:sterol desaturase/sphingolipid hydroxylase (fatty acid hydroxylase superfamily)